MLRINGFLAILSALVIGWGVAAEKEAAPKDTTNAEEKKKDDGVEVKEGKDAEIIVEEMVVTATRTEAPVKQSTSSQTVISSLEIEQKQQATVLDALRTVPALDVVQTGGPGRATSVFMRGAKSEHTLVLVDGIELNDPFSPGRSYDFANLTTDNIERVEVVRGPQSTLYGSDAIGGVINIITKKGVGKPTGFISAEGGSFYTAREKIGFRGGHKWVNGSIGVSRVDTDGFSAANEELGNSEDDNYENTAVSARLGVTPIEQFSLDLITRYMNSEVDLDGGGGRGGDDPNDVFESEQLFFRSQANISLFDNVWKQKIGFSYSDHDRDYHNDFDADHPSDMSRGVYDGKIFKFDWQNDLYIHDMNTVTVGMETEEEQGEGRFISQSAFGPFNSRDNRRTARNNAWYIQDQIRAWDTFNATVGVRLDDHEEFGSAFTFRVAAAYLIKKTNTRIRASIGTGFKAPTLFQLYSQYGDESLEPEESLGWDFGVEQSLFEDRLSFGATFFMNEFENLIDFDGGAFRYMNVAEAETYGVEFFAVGRPTENLSLKVSYTFTETEDQDGENLLRRADHKIGFTANYRFLEKGNVNLNLIYVGLRDDRDFSTFPATRVVLDPYTVINIAVSYDIHKNVRLFGRVENLLNMQYEEVLGYGTSPIAAYGGVKVSF